MTWVGSFASEADLLLQSAASTLRDGQVRCETHEFRAGFDEPLLELLALGSLALQRLQLCMELVRDLLLPKRANSQGDLLQTKATVYRNAQTRRSRSRPNLRAVRLQQ